jgi:hypothetical protein
MITFLRNVILGEPRRNVLEPNNTLTTIKILEPFDDGIHFRRGQIITIDSLRPAGPFTSIVVVNKIDFVVLHTDFAILL